ncbi:hypothetical protein HZS_6746 [Henneguya salminicola]|nr:hypothetical protein HZS_6746 [Henneguya salminicola]
MTAPLEHYMNISKEYRIAKINDVIQKGSILIGRVCNVSGKLVILDAIQICGKRNRKIYDLEIEVFVQVNDFREILPQEAEFFKVVVTSVTTKINSFIAYASLDNSLLSKEDSQHVLVLFLLSLIQGKFNVNNISEHLLLYQRKISSESYIFNLCSNSNFFNSTISDKIECKLGLDVNKSNDSLIMDNLVDYDAESLRVKQFKKYSEDLTLNAIQQIHKKCYDKAERILNTVLQVSPDHVDAIVAFGACKANQKLFSDAINFFTRALEIDPEHKNALNYLVEATISHAKSFEAKKDIIQAANCYNSIIDLPALQKSTTLLQKIKETLQNVAVTKKEPEAPQVSKSSSVSSTKQEKNNVENFPKPIEQKRTKIISTDLYIPPSKRTKPSNIYPNIPILCDKKLKHFSSTDLELLKDILARK